MKQIISAVLLVSVGLGSAARAEDSTQASRQETIGVGSGVVIGAAAGGPVGAILGGALGAWLGDHLFQTGAERDEYKIALTAATRDLNTTALQVAELEHALTDSRRQRREAEQRWTQTVAESINISVLFKTGETTVDAQTSERLARLAGLIGDLGPVVVDVEGHADARGSKEFNEQLSAERAATVRDILVKGGVTADRITTAALGESMSSGDEAGTDEHALDRRVEIRLGIGDLERLAQRE